MHTRYCLYLLISQRLRPQRRHVRQALRVAAGEAAPLCVFLIFGGEGEGMGWVKTLVGGLACIARPIRSTQVYLCTWGTHIYIGNDARE